MLQNTLSNIKVLFKTKLEMNDATIDSYASLLKNYKIGMWIYPGIIKRKLNIPIVDVYYSLALLEEEKIVHSYYEIYCNNCHKSLGYIFEAINEIPYDFECESCHDVFRSLDNTILIYKVIVE